MCAKHCRIEFINGKTYLNDEDVSDKIRTMEVTKIVSPISSIIKLREVSEGTPVSYSRRFVTKRKTKIATIGVGYSDGIFRSLFNKSF